MKSRYTAFALLALLGCGKSEDYIIHFDVEDTWHGSAWDLPTSEPPDIGLPNDNALPRDLASSDQHPFSPLPEGPVAFITDRNAFPLLLELVNEAKSELLILHLEWLPGQAPDQLLQAVKLASERGVKVRVLLEGDIPENGPRISDLLAAGAQARLDSSSRTLHLKLAVADSTYVLVGSTNISTSSFFYNHEANFFFNDPTVAVSFANYALAIWTSDSDSHSLDYASNPDLKLIGDAQYLDVALPIMEGASERLLVVAYMFDPNDPDGSRLLKAIATSKKKGLDVRVILEQSDFDEAINKINKQTQGLLKSYGVEARMDPKAVVTHAKMVLADDWVIIYSGNFVASGLRRNHEAGAAVRSKALAGEAKAYFEGLWATSAP